MWLKETSKVLGGLLLAAVLLWWVFRGIDTESLWGHLREASLAGLIACGLLNAGHNVFRVLRWRALLEPVRRGLPFRSLFEAIILGYATSWVIPGRLGEVLRPALLAGREDLPLGPCLGSVLADRLLDGMAVLGLFAVGIVVTPLGADSAEHVGLIRASAIGLVALIGIPFVILLVASSARSTLERWFSAGGPRRAWLGRFVVSLADGVEALKRPRLLVRIVLYTLLAWGTIAVSIWIGIRACGIDISFGGTLVLLPLLVLGIALPTPGGAGGYHAAMRVGLTKLFLVGRTAAVGAGLLVHAATVLPIVVLGGLVLVFGRSSIQDLVRALRQVRAMGSPASPAGVTRRPAEKLM
jgi:uncharacterized protein (TIRG00374 family)